MKNTTLLTCLGVLLVLPLFGDKPPPVVSNSKSQKSAAEVIKFKHLSIDRKKGVITIDAKVLRAEYGLEFLLCRNRTKEYESLLSTKATGQQLHAGLLMLGLDPGKPAEFDGEKYIPPRGGSLKIVIKWKDKTGKLHQSCVADWVKSDKKDRAKFKPERFIFVGSEILPDGTYEADQTGGLIALANLSSAVIDVPFKSTRSLENRRFEMDADKLPPPGTEVKILITPDLNAVNAPHARALLEINQVGQMLINGGGIDRSQLQDWGEQYIRKHTRGRVVIRSAPRGLSIYSSMARSELELGGVFEFEEYTAPLQTPLLPRTVSQKATMLASMKKRLADPDERINNPKREITRTLDQIKHQRRELKRLDAIWAQYAKSLKKLEPPNDSIHRQE